MLASLAAVLSQPAAARVRISADGTASSCVDRRPPPAQRKFRSPAVDAAIDRIALAMNDSELACLFSNTLPNTLDTTLVSFTDTPEAPDSFVITGDIPAMWLRDATNQVLPYLRYVKQEPRLARVIAGLIARQTAQVLADPYANAHTQHAYERSPDVLTRAGASVLYVRAARTSLLRAVRTGGEGQLAPGRHHGTYAVRRRAARPGQAPRYVRRTCTRLPRTVAPQEYINPERQKAPHAICVG